MLHGIDLSIFSGTRPTSARTMFDEFVLGELNPGSLRPCGYILQPKPSPLVKETSIIPIPLVAAFLFVYLVI
jgi:hypothetical protein